MRSASSLLLLAACFDPDRPPTTGEYGELDFVDLTVHADDGLGAAGLGWAVATGAELELGVYGWEAADGELATSVVEGDAFSLVRDVGVTLRVRAEHAGEATLLVLADDGREDRVTLTAADVATVVLQPHADSTLVSPTVPDALTANGWSALPGAEIGLAAFLFDEAGARLTGEGALTWTSTDDSTFRPFTTVDNGAFLVVGTTIGDHNATGGFGSDFAYRVLGDDAPRTLHLYTPDYAAPQELLAIEAEAGGALFGLLLFDEEGRYLVPPVDATLTVEVIDGPSDLITASEYSPALLGFSTTLCPGTGTARLSLAGATRDFAISVTGDACDG